MSIQEHLNKIRNAIYGREVRESIAKGIETAYDDASEKDNANMEVKIARGTHPNLRSRLDETTAQLAQTNNEVDKKVGNGKLATMADMAQDVKESMTGGSVAVVGSNSIIAENIVDKQVTIEKLSHFDINRENFVNPDEVDYGYIISVNDGNVYTNTDFNTSDFIPVSEGEEIYSSSTLTYALYDGEKNFVSGTTGNSYTLPIIIPTGVSFLRMVFSESDSMHVISKGSLKPVLYDDADISITNEGVKKAIRKSMSEIEEPYVSAMNIEDNSVTPSKTSFFGIIKQNFVNPDEVDYGYIISVANGNIYENADFNTSDFIPVSEGEEIYSLNTLTYALYDENKQFVSGTTGNTYTFPIVIPGGVSFLRMVFHSVETMPVISKGSLKLVPYSEDITEVVDTDVVEAFKRLITSDVEGTKTINSIMSDVVISDRTMNIKLLGDSITAGVGGTGYATDGEIVFGSHQSSPNGHCWANSLGDYLESKYNCSVKNYGVSGLTSWGLKSSMAQSIREEDDIVICMIGTNNRNDTQKRLYDDLIEVGNYVKSLGKEIIFMSCIPASIAGEKGKAFHMEDVDSVIMKASSDLNQEYISLYKLFIEYCHSRDLSIDSFLADGLHPNDAGYDVMFYLVCHALGIGQKRVGATW